MAWLMVLALIGGCSSDEGSEDSEAAASPEATEDASGAETEPALTPDEEAVLAAYQGYWTTYAAAVSEEQIGTYLEAIENDTVGQTQLPDFTAGETQQQVLSHILSLAEGGRYMSGEPERLDPVVSELDMEIEQPAAVVTDCLDVEDWRLWDADSGEELAFPEERTVRYQLTAHLESWEGTWRVIEAQPEDGSTC